MGFIDTGSKRIHRKEQSNRSSSLKKGKEMYPQSEHYIQRQRDALIRAFPIHRQQHLYYLEAYQTCRISSSPHHTYKIRIYILTRFPGNYSLRIPVIEVIIVICYGENTGCHRKKLRGEARRYLQLPKYLCQCLDLETVKPPQCLTVNKKMTRSGYQEHQGMIQGLEERTIHSR